MPGNRHLCRAFSGLLLGAVCLAGFCLGSKAPFFSFEYGLILDAGSTGTRVFVYRFSLSDNTLGMLDSFTTNIKPGISSFASQVDRVGPSLSPLIEFAKSKVPTELHGTTPVFFKATAGMRLLPFGVQHSLLEAVRSFLAESPFLFKPQWASVMSGQEEGFYGWVQANHLLGHLDPPHSTASTVGILDLGGASTQIAFIPAAHDQTKVSSPDGFVDGVYARSHLGFGLYQAHARHNEMLLADIAGNAPSSGDQPIIEDPCIPHGLNESRTVNGKVYEFHGTGEFAACGALLRRLVNTSVDPCPHPPCSLMDIQRPHTSGQFVAFAYYYDRSVTLGLGGTVSVQDIEEAAQAVCAMHWDDVHGTYSAAEGGEYARELCFSATYFSTLLHYGFGIPRTERTLTLAARVKGCELGWSYGAILYEMKRMLADYSLPPSSPLPSLQCLGPLLLWLPTFASLLALPGAALLFLKIRKRTDKVKAT